MITISRKYELVVKANASAYIKANKEVVVPGAKIIGSSLTAVNKMLSLSSELKVLMPEMLGLSPTSGDWDKMVARYWHSLSEPINPTGRALETGFTYDITDSTKQQSIHAISEQLKQNKEKGLTTDDDLKDYIYDRLAKVEEAYNLAVLDANKLGEQGKEEALKTAYDSKYEAIWKVEADHYKIGTPINPFEYLLWKFCLVYGDVANDFSFANKSTKIRFYLSSEDAKKAIERVKQKTKTQAMQLYLKLISSRNSVIDLLFAIGEGDKVFTEAKVNSGEDLDLQLHILLQSEMEKDPAKFISIASDKNIAIKGMIEKYITYNLLRRLQGTNIIVDYNNPSMVIGNNINEAVSYFSNQENAAIISEYKTKFKDLNSKLDVTKVATVDSPKTVTSSLDTTKS